MLLLRDKFVISVHIVWLFVLVIKCPCKVQAVTSCVTSHVPDTKVSLKKLALKIKKSGYLTELNI